MIFADLSNHSETAKPDATKSLTEVCLLMQEYFRLKDADKNVRAERNKYMKTHRCLNAERPSSDFVDQSDYEDTGGECIYRTVGMGGYPAPMCEVCAQRNTWYLLRQSYGRRRSQITRRVRRLVEGNDLAGLDSDANTSPSNPQKTN